jgi:hypothetical protein
MRAVAHGFKPTQVKAPPVEVAREFDRADQRKRGEDDRAKKRSTPARLMARALREKE